MTCCGSRARNVGRRVTRPPAVLDNPMVARGVEVVYVGSKSKRFPCVASGLVYHVAPGSRFVRVDRRDVDELFATGEFTRP